MDDDLLDQLPEPYAQALRLQRAGLGFAEIAEAVDVPPEAIETLLRLAEAKLSRLNQPRGATAGDALDEQEFEGDEGDSHPL